MVMQTIKSRSPIVPFRAKENVLSFKYMKLLRMYVWALGLWPDDEFGKKKPIMTRIHKNYYISQGVILFVGQFYFMLKYFDTMNFFLKGYNYLLILFTFLTWMRVIITTQKAYGAIVKTFVNTLHLAHRKLYGEYEKQIYNTIEKVSYIFTIIITIIAIMAVIFFCTAPIYLNYKNGFFSGEETENSTYNCIVCFTVPKIIDTHDYSLVSTIYTIYLSYVCSISVCGVDILLTLMAIQLIGNILVLRNRLDTISASKHISEKETFEDTQSTTHIAFNEEENKIIHGKLVDCIKHHTVIIMFAEMMSEFFGPVLGVTYGFHLTACCLLLLECGVGTEAIFRFAPVTSIIFGQLILLSVVFEIVATVSEKLPNSVYFTPWYRMDSRNRRTVCIMLVRAQRPITVTALGLTNVGVTTMAQILKTTASYYALLNSIGN